MLKIKSICLLAGAAMLLCTEAFAFDGNRKGLQLSFGIGVHGGNFEDYESSFDTGTGAEGGLASSFKVGIGLTDKFSLYYVRNASWFRLQSGANDPFIYLAGISGLGASYYFERAASSPYIMLAAGIGDYGAPFAENINMRTGASVMVGLGYEFARRHMLEVTGLFVELERDFDTEVAVSGSLQLTYNFMLY